MAMQYLLGSGPNKRVFLISGEQNVCIGYISAALQYFIIELFRYTFDCYEIITSSCDFSSYLYLWRVCFHTHPSSTRNIYTCRGGHKLQHLYCHFSSLQCPSLDHDNKNTRGLNTVEIQNMNIWCLVQKHSTAIYIKATLQSKVLVCINTGFHQ